MINQLCQQLNQHNFCTSLDVKFDVMSGPVDSRKGRTFEARSSSYAAHASVIDFFEALFDHWSHNLTDVAGVTIYLWTLYPQQCVIRYGILDNRT